MYMKQDLSDEIIVNSDLDTFRQDEAKNMELNCKHDTHRMRDFAPEEKYLKLFLLQSHMLLESLYVLFWPSSSRRKWDNRDRPRPPHCHYQ